MKTQTHTHTAADKVQSLLPPSSSHELRIGDLLVGTPGYTLRACATPPYPNYTTRRQVHLRARQTVSKTLVNTHTHTHSPRKIPSY